MAKYVNEEDAVVTDGSSTTPGNALVSTPDNQPPAEAKASVDAVIGKAEDIAKTLDEIVEEVSEQANLETAVTNRERAVASYVLVSLAFGGADWLAEKYDLPEVQWELLTELSPIFKAVMDGAEVVENVPTEVWVALGYFLLRRWAGSSEQEVRDIILSELTQGVYDEKLDNWKKSDLWSRVAAKFFRAYLEKIGKQPPAWTGKAIRMGGPKIWMIYLAFAWRSEIWGAGKAAYDMLKPHKDEVQQETREEIDADIYDTGDPDNPKKLDINPETGEVTVLNSGGLIAPSKRGSFKAQATKMGMGVQEAANKILAAPEGRYSPAMRKKANFARNFAKNDGGLIAATRAKVRPLNRLLGQ